MRQARKGDAPLRVIGYLRYSPRPQTESEREDAMSLRVQRARVVDYSRLYELDLIDAVEDPLISAKSLDRPVLQGALARLKAGEADGLVVAKLDRLSRSVEDWSWLIRHYFGVGERAGKQLFSVGESIDTRTATGRMTLNIIMTIAEWERETIGERTRESLQHRIGMGRRVGKLRIGFDVDAEGRLVDNPAEQATLATIRELRAAGLTYRKIAAELDRLGIPPKGRAGMTKPGKSSVRWCHTTIGHLLKHRGPREGTHGQAGEGAA